MNKDFELAVSLLADLCNFIQRQFASQIHASRAEALGKAHAIGIGDAHLSAAVNFEVWGDLFCKRTDAEVLHDDGVCASSCDGFDGFSRGFEFAIKDQGVERDVTFDASLVKS